MVSQTLFQPTMSDAEFVDLASVVRDATGIVLPPRKKALLASRLLRRLEALSLKTFADYHGYLARADFSGEERLAMIGCVTTHKTSFFREDHHFRTLQTSVLQPMTRVRHRARPLRIWSAACSSGEEAYSIAMTTIEALGRDAASRVEIIATDVDPKVLEVGETGVYSASALEGVPEVLRSKHFLRGKNEQQGRFRVNAELRRLVHFRRLNLVASPWIGLGTFDVIFCRNVMIYFDMSTRQRLVDALAQHLSPGGLLMLGNAEHLRWSQTFEPLGQTVYRFRPGGARPTFHGEDAVSERIPIGGLAVSSQGLEVSTVLGSCVSACLYDPAVSIGGMNHFMLPGDDERGGSARYGVHAMELLVNGLMKLGADRSRLKAKLFGAAQVVPDLRSHDVAARNAAFVRKFLADEGIPITAESLEGNVPLLVKFRTDTGRALVKSLPEWSHSVDREEAGYETPKEPAGDVVLWGPPS